MNVSRFRKLLLVSLTILCSCSSSAMAEEGQAHEVTRLLKIYCAGCHGVKKQEGNLRLDRLSPTVATLNDLERWVDVGDQLKSGNMPPATARQPSVEELSTLTTGVSKIVRDSSTQLQKPGRLEVRRLTREQYNATLQDLLGLPLNFVKELPAEALSDDGFSNDAELLNLSPLYIEYFLENAQRAMGKTLVSESHPEPGYQFTLNFSQLEESIKQETLTHFWPIYADGKVRLGKPAKGEQWPPMAAKYHGFPWKPNPKIKPPQQLIEFQNGMLAAPRAKLHYGQIKSNWGELSLPGDRNRSSFPTEGWLRIRITAGSEIPPGAAPPKLQLMLNDDVLHGKTLNDLGTQTITASKDHPDIYDYLVRLENLNLPSQNNEKGPPYFEIYNPRWEAALDPENPKDRGKGRLVPGANPQAVAFIKSVEVNWPYVATWPPQHHTRIVNAAPQTSSERETVSAILNRFMRRAYRRPVTLEQTEQMWELFRIERADGRTFLEALRTTLATVLCSPEFLYIRQPVSNGILDHYAMASRLSYLLWNSLPDEELLTLAKQNKLHDPEVLEAQAKRMLADPRSRRFVKQFASEWLDLPGLENVAVNRELFKEFPLGTKSLLEQETLSFFAELLNHDLSVLNVIDSEFLMMNNRLALYYGIPGVYENEFRRVPATTNRGGVLTQASILIATGTGEASHPFRRGTWVLERILGTPPPPPPSVVPELATDDPEFKNRPLTQQLELHRQQQSCAACHAKLDPWEIALENFDAIGLWRTNYRFQNKAKVDSIAKLPDGTELHGIDGLKTVILNNHQDLFARNVAQKLLTYALARQLDATDETTLDELTRSLKNNDYRLKQFVIEIIKHPAFQRL